jgi:ElaB/YqjD/DUF883 family membrane-anchored ribosome-binding protein
MTERSLVYRLSVTGQNEGIQSIKSFLEQVKRMAAEERAIVDANERAVTGAKKRGSGDRKAVVDDETKHAAMLAKLNAKLEKDNAKERVKLAKDTEKEKLKASQNAVREHARLEKEKTRSLEREERERTRISESEEKKRVQGFVRASRQAQREFNQATKQMQRDAERRARDSAFDDKRFYRGVGRSMVDGGINALKMPVTMASRGVSTIARGMSLNKAYDVSDIIAERMSMEKTLVDLQIEARQAGDKNYRFNIDDARSKITKAATSTGYSVEEALAYVDTRAAMGSGQRGVEGVGRGLRIAKAMGTTPAVVAKLSEQLALSTGQKGKQMTEDEIEQAMAVLSAIGKSGNMRGSEIANYSERLISSMVANNLDPRTEMKRYASFLNVVKSSRGSTAMTATSALSMFNDMIKNADVIDKGKRNVPGLGVKVFDKEGNQRNPLEVMTDIIEKTGGDPRKFMKYLPGSKGGAAVMPFASAYREVYKETKGSEANKKKAARSRVEKMLSGEEFMGKEANSVTLQELQKEMQMDADRSINSEANKISLAVQSLRQKIYEQLKPAIDKLAELIPKLIPDFEEVIKHVGNVITFVEKHPLLSVATVGSAGMLLGAGRGLAQAGAARLGDSLVNTVPRLASKGVVGGVMGRAAGVIGGVLSQAGSTPVYITGVAPGVALGGIGGGAPGGAGGIGGVGGRMVGALGGAAVVGLIGAATLALYGAMDYARNHGSGLTPGRRATEKEKEEYKDIVSGDARKRREDGMLQDLLLTSPQNPADDPNINLANAEIRKKIWDSLSPEERKAAEDSAPRGTGDGGGEEIRKYFNTQFGGGQDAVKDLSQVGAEAKLLAANLGQLNAQISNTKSNVSNLKGTIPH